MLVHPLDVTDAQRVQAAVGAAEDRFGGIDVLANHAGRGWYGSVEGTPDSDVRASFELKSPWRERAGTIPDTTLRRAGVFRGRFGAGDLTVTQWRPRRRAHPSSPLRTGPHNVRAAASARLIS
ncbi:SDR family NAD(P)-dependent oxidoreductase [Streptomyces sp. NBC_00433]